MFTAGYDVGLKLDSYRFVRKGLMMYVHNFEVKENTFHFPWPFLAPVCIFTVSLSLIFLPFKHYCPVHLTAMFVKVSSSVFIQSKMYFPFFCLPSPSLLHTCWNFRDLFRLPVNRSKSSSTLKLFCSFSLLQKFGQPLSLYISTMRPFRFIESSAEINVKYPPYWSAISKCLLPVSEIDWNPLVIDL